MLQGDRELPRHIALFIAHYVETVFFVFLDMIERVPYNITFFHFSPVECHFGLHALTAPSPPPAE